MAKASDNPYPSILIEEGTEPTAPAAGHQRLYIDSTTHLLKRTDSSGTDVTIEGLSNPMTTAGDVIYGGASGAPTRLGVGTAGQVLTVNAGATAPEWAAAGGGSGSFSGNIIIAHAAGFTLDSDTQAGTPGASVAFIQPIVIPGAMKVRALSVAVSSGGTGTFQWGLFDPSSDPTSCTKLAGGSGVMNSTGFVDIAATGAPVDVTAGAYFLILHAPASNPATIRVVSNDAGVAPTQKNQGSYTWDDTPDITSGWNDHNILEMMFLRGDIDASNQW